MSRVAARLAFAGALLAPLASARADEGAACGARGWPVIALADDALPAPFDGAFRARLVAQLGAGLEARHLELCAGRDVATAASTLALSVTGGDDLAVTVRDAVTGKQLVRTIALATVPPDARPLTVALAVDELLRASWVELALRDAPAPARPSRRDRGARARRACR